MMAEQQTTEGICRQPKIRGSLLQRIQLNLGGY